MPVYSHIYASGERKAVLFQFILKKTTRLFMISASLTASVHIHPKILHFHFLNPSKESGAQGSPGILL